MPDSWSRRGKAKRSHTVFPSEDLSDLKHLLQDLVFGVTLGWISWKCKQQGSVHVLTNHDPSFFVLFYCATSWPRTCAKATPVPTNWDLSHAKSRMWVLVSMLKISHPDLYLFTWWDTEAKKLYKIWQSSNSFMHTFDINCQLCRTNQVGMILAFLLICACTLEAWCKLLCSGV